MRSPLHRAPPGLVPRLACVCLLMQVGLANVENLIFTAPSLDPELSSDSTLSALSLRALTPHASSVRTSLKRVFTSEESQGRGHSSWVLLTNLTENQRYGVRVCWSALEPTRFDLKIHTNIQEVLSDSRHIQSLRAYSASQGDDQSLEELTRDSPHGPSTLLIEIQAAADYFTDVKHLMTDPPPVLVDITLDPFLCNLVPRSLLPNVCYLIFLAVTTWFVGRWIVSGLQSAVYIESRAKKHD